LAAYALPLVSCNDGLPEADAYGNFEATTVLVSSEAQGTLKQLNVSEGEIFEKDTLAGIIDTSDAVLKRSQLLARMKVMQANAANIDMQVAVQLAQRDNLVREVERINNLLIDNAATPATVR
jgi:HlyD family secretion protein